MSRSRAARPGCRRTSASLPSFRNTCVLQGVHGRLCLRLAIPHLTLEMNSCRLRRTTLNPSAASLLSARATSSGNGRSVRRHSGCVRLFLGAWPHYVAPGPVPWLPLTMWSHLRAMTATMNWTRKTSLISEQTSRQRKHPSQPPTRTKSAPQTRIPTSL